MKSRATNIFLSASWFLLLFFTSTPASAITRVVVQNSAQCPEDTVTTPCYLNVQSAIDAAAAGDTILIESSPSSYVGNFVVNNKSLTIAGRETEGTFLSGGGSGTVLTINASTAFATTIRNLTFLNATTGIVVQNSTSAVNIVSNIFEVGTGSTAIQTQVSQSTTIANNMFYKNGAGIVSDTNTLSINNNVFTQNTGATAIAPSTMSLASIQNNLFNGGTIGVPGIVLNSTDPTDPNNKLNLADKDPLFVDPDNADITKKDFHLKSGSPCQDAGNGSAGVDSVDGTAPDIGVYGGSFSDTIPNRVTILSSSATATAPFEITLNWSANPAYTVTGYKVYYGYNSGDYHGNDAIVSGVTRTSPIPAGNVTTLTLGGLSPASAIPSAPALATPQPQNATLNLTWSAVPGATGYAITYHEIDPTTGPTVTVPINSNITSFPLTGLTNGHTYLITVSAVIQAIYYLAVTAHDTSGQSGGDPGRSHESAYSTERHFNIGPPTEGPPSNEVLGTPDELVPAPYLPNTGCFIASAAYGSHDAPPVRVLRAFRDRVLAATSSGRAFIAWYYRTSPRLAEQLNGHPGLKPLVRIALEPVVAAAFLVTETRPAICVALLLSLAAAAYLARRRRRTADITRS